MSKLQCYQLASRILENFEGETRIPYLRDLSIVENEEIRTIRYQCGRYCRPMIGCSPRYCTGPKEVTVRNTNERLEISLDGIDLSSQKAKSEVIPTELINE